METGYISIDGTHVKDGRRGLTSMIEHKDYLEFFKLVPGKSIHAPLIEVSSRIDKSALCGKVDKEVADIVDSLSIAGWCELDGYLERIKKEAELAMNELKEGIKEFFDDCKVTFVDEIQKHDVFSVALKIKDDTTARGDYSRRYLIPALDALACCVDGDLLMFVREVDVSWQDERLLEISLCEDK